MEIIQIIVAILSVVTTSLAFYVQYSVQLERRHGEILNLKVTLILDFEKLVEKWRYTSATMLTIRILIRRFPDSENKFELIEKMPLLISRSDEQIERLNVFIKKLRLLNPQDFNNSNTLILLREIQGEYPDFERLANDMEDDLTEILKQSERIAESNENIDIR